MCIKGTKKDEQIVELVIIESHFPVQNFLWRTLYWTVDCPYDREYCSWQWDVVHGKKVLSVTGDNVHGRTDILSMAGDTVLAIFCLYQPRPKWISCGCSVWTWFFTYWLTLFPEIQMGKSHHDQSWGHAEKREAIDGHHRSGLSWSIWRVGLLVFHREQTRV